MNIKEERLKKGWTQQDLADKLGMDRISINRMENGKQKIEKRTKLAIKQLIQ